MTLFDTLQYLSLFAKKKQKKQKKKGVQKQLHQQTLGLTAEDYSRLQQTTVVPVEKDIFCAALL